LVPAQCSLAAATWSKLRTSLVRMNKQENITRHMKRCRSSKAKVHFKESEKVPVYEIKSLPGKGYIL
jgi:adenine C2-methylase RlmN of 23S rRNA A2503 and tRNA A37